MLRTALFVLFFALLFSACAAGGTSAADVSRYLADALADNTLTAEEVQGLQNMLEVYGSSAGSMDWMTLAGTVLGGAVTAITGVRLLPNSLIVGKKEAQAIDKAAGIS